MGSMSQCNFRAAELESRLSTTLAQLEASSAEVNRLSDAARASDDARVALNNELQAVRRSLEEEAHKAAQADHTIAEVRSPCISSAQL